VEGVLVDVGEMEIERRNTQSLTAERYSAGFSTNPGIPLEALSLRTGCPRLIFYDYCRYDLCRAAFGS